jgi:hypothetical protein
MTEISQEPEGQHREIHFEVDSEPLETNERHLTPVQIMDLAGIDPANHYLSEIEGHHTHSYKDAPNTPIVIREGARFVSASTGPTPTS